MQQFLSRFIVFVFISSLLSCSKEPIKITPNEYHLVVDKLTEVMIHDIFSPPVASRIYAYPNIAAYQVLNTENGAYQSLENQLNELKKIPFISFDKNANKQLAALIAYIDVAKEVVFSKEKITVFRDSLYKD